MQDVGSKQQAHTLWQRFLSVTVMLGSIQLVCSSLCVVANVAKHNKLQLAART